MLLVANDPTPVQLLAQLVELPVDLVQAMCEELATGYEADGRGFQLVEIAGGWRYQTHPDTHAYVERFALEGVPNRLSSAALETMAIVAYKQPISRAQIGAIRGVNVDGVLRTLVQRGYVEEQGRDDGPGQATLFGTTPFFLEQVGLMSLDDLPPLGDFVPSAQVLEALEHTLRVDGEPDPAATIETAEAGAAGPDSASAGTDPSATEVVDLRTNGHPNRTNGSSNGNGHVNGSGNGTSDDRVAPEPVVDVPFEPTADHEHPDHDVERSTEVIAADGDGPGADAEDLFEVVTPGRDVDLTTTPPAEPVELHPAPGEPVGVDDVEPAATEPGAHAEVVAETETEIDVDLEPPPAGSTDRREPEATVLTNEPQPEVVADPEVEETSDPTTTGADGVDDARFPGAGDHRWPHPAHADDVAAPAVRPPAEPGGVVAGAASGPGPIGRPDPTTDGPSPAGPDPVTNGDGKPPEPGDA